MKWNDGIIVKIISGTTYLVKVGDNIVFEHVNCLRKSILNDIPQLI